jgi:hypothetical protein
MSNVECRMSNVEPVLTAQHVSMLIFEVFASDIKHQTLNIVLPALKPQRALSRRREHHVY